MPITNRRKRLLIAIRTNETLSEIRESYMAHERSLFEEILTDALQKGFVEATDTGTFRLTPDGVDKLKQAAQQQARADEQRAMLGLSVPKPPDIPEWEYLIKAPKENKAKK